MLSCLELRVEGHSRCTCEVIPENSVFLLRFPAGRSAGEQNWMPKCKGAHLSLQPSQNGRPKTEKPWNVCSLLSLSVLHVTHCSSYGIPLCYPVFVDLGVCFPLQDSQSAPPGVAMDAESSGHWGGLASDVQAPIGRFFLFVCLVIWE